MFGVQGLSRRGAEGQRAQRGGFYPILQESPNKQYRNQKTLCVLRPSAPLRQTQVRTTPPQPPQDSFRLKSSYPNRRTTRSTPVAGSYRSRSGCGTPLNVLVFTIV